MPEETFETRHFRQSWQQQLSAAFKTIDHLCQYLQLEPEELPVSPEAAGRFALKVPLSFAASMEKGNPRDPLLRQVFPVDQEMLNYPGYNDDPVGDLPSAAASGVLHKYHGRVLLINTGSCAINCRYCFRRNFPYGELQISRQNEALALQYIKDHHDISEVILSGGDPLLLNDDRLSELFRHLAGIQHVKRIRIHSRLPIVLPARITDELLATLTGSPKQIVLVIHCNHPNEISERVIAGLQKIRQSGLTVFNQSVLLKEVNDDVQVLCALSEKLFEQGVIPYYLHLLDKATGTGHFEVPESEALLLIRQIQALMPGYLVPKLVRESAGGESKDYVVD